MRALHSVRFRAQKKMTSREDLLVKVARWLDDYKDLEATVEDTPVYAFTPLAGELARLPKKDRATKGAALARKAVGLEPEALIGDICGLLEDHGVKVFTPELASEGFFGLSIAESDGGRAIVVNTWDRISVERLDLHGRPRTGTSPLPPRGVRRREHRRGRRPGARGRPLREPFPRCPRNASTKSGRRLVAWGSWSASSR